jgi:hypothetical protein
MKNLQVAAWAAAGALLMASAVALAQGGPREGQGKAIVTVLAGKHSELAPKITVSELNLKVNGTATNITGWKPLREPDGGLELVILIGNAAHNMNGGFFDEIAQFIKSMHPQTKVAVAYMQNGTAKLAGPLSSDHAKVAGELRLTIGPGVSPFFCLSDLAQHWPSSERGVRREVLLISSGIDTWDRGYDPDDPYVQAAIADSVRAGLVVYSIYWQNRVSQESSFDGQNLLQLITAATGGRGYGFGTDNPVSFKPYLDDLAVRLNNQYELDFTSQLKGKPEIKNFHLKAQIFASEIDAPQQVFVNRSE